MEATPAITLKHLFREGVVEGTWGDKPIAIYDLFRVEDGKIAERWDVLQEIPADTAHENGMF